MQTLYRIQPSDGKGRLYSARQLAAMKFCHVPADQSRDPHTPRGQWYCENEDCVVREVVIAVKLYGELMPEHMACPVCNSQMSFHYFVETETLVVVDETDPTAATGQAAGEGVPE